MEEQLYTRPVERHINLTTRRLPQRRSHCLGEASRNPTIDQEDNGARQEAAAVAMTVVAVTGSAIRDHLERNGIARRGTVDVVFGDGGLESSLRWIRLLGSSIEYCVDETMELTFTC
jgi:hypothetical protein